MNEEERLSDKHEKKIDEALRSSSEVPPQFMSKMILRAAKNKVDTKSQSNVEKTFYNYSWRQLLPLAACIIISFYAGFLFQNDTPSITKPPSLVFQGDPNDVSDLKLNEWTEDKLLRAIAEAALAGDVERAEKLISVYKTNFPKGDQQP